MREFNLVLLPKRKKIGTVEAENDLKRIEIKLLNRYRVQYRNLLTYLIEAVKSRGDFEVTQRGKDLVFRTTSRDFWSAFIQALMIHLDIFLVLLPS